MTTVGILGVGHLAGYLVPALLAGECAPRILLSPRNAERAARLAAEYGLTVAKDNDDLIRQSDIVLLSTRPADACTAIEGMPWREDHLLISLCAGVALADLSGAASPGETCRAMPLSSAAIGESPTALYPENGPARLLLARLGPVHSLPDEARFEVASVSGALHGWIFKLIEELTVWFTEAGLDEHEAREIVSQTLRGAAGMALAEPERSLEDILLSLATPGGITELGLKHLEDRKALTPWHEACAAVLEKTRGGGGS